MKNGSDVTNGGKLLPKEFVSDEIETFDSHFCDDDDDNEEKDVKMTLDELIAGALESAFWALDRLILKDKESGFRIRYITVQKI